MSKVEASSHGNLTVISKETCGRWRRYIQQERGGSYPFGGSEYLRPNQRAGQLRRKWDEKVKVGESEWKDRMRGERNGTKFDWFTTETGRRSESVPGGVASKG
jgi:hypothetical protein